MTQAPHPPEASLHAIGDTVVESALLTFLSRCTPEEQAAFAQFVEKHQESPTLVDDIQTQFPDFGSILEAEVMSFQADLATVTQPPEDSHP